MQAAAVFTTDTWESAQWGAIDGLMERFSAPSS